MNHINFINSVSSPKQINLKWWTRYALGSTACMILTLSIIHQRQTQQLHAAQKKHHSASPRTHHQKKDIRSIKQLHNHCYYLIAGLTALDAKKYTVLRCVVNKKITEISLACASAADALSALNHMRETHKDMYIAALTHDAKKTNVPYTVVLRME